MPDVLYFQGPGGLRGITGLMGSKGERVRARLTVTHITSQILNYEQRVLPLLSSFLLSTCDVVTTVEQLSDFELIS